MTKVLQPFQDAQKRLAAEGNQISLSLQPLLKRFVTIDWQEV